MGTVRDRRKNQGDETSIPYTRAPSRKLCGPGRCAGFDRGCYDHEPHDHDFHDDSDDDNLDSGDHDDGSDYDHDDAAGR